jgi:hypothetical protein
MRFQTRAFLICFLPFALLLAAGLWMVQLFVQSNVRNDLRASLRQNELAIARVHAQADLQNSRFLKIVGDNAALKAGMQLLRSESGSQAARMTVEDQPRELGQHMGFDFLLVSSPSGTPLAGVVRQSEGKQAGRVNLCHWICPSSITVRMAFCNSATTLFRSHQSQWMTMKQTSATLQWASILSFPALPLHPC